VERKRYDEEFKRTAVELSQKSGNSVPKVAKELGISETILYKWVRIYSTNPNHKFPGSGNLSPENKDIAAIKKELADLKEENAILKKAMAIFASPRK
jgi:transposase